MLGKVLKKENSDKGPPQGSFLVMGMPFFPLSMNTLTGLYYSLASSLTSGNSGKAVSRLARLWNRLKSQLTLLMPPEWGLCFQSTSQLPPAAPLVFKFQQKCLRPQMNSSQGQMAWMYEKEDHKSSYGWFFDLTWISAWDVLRFRVGNHGSWIDAGPTCRGTGGSVCPEWSAMSAVRLKTIKLTEGWFAFYYYHHVWAILNHVGAGVMLIIPQIFLGGYILNNY